MVAATGGEDQPDGSQNLGVASHIIILFPEEAN